MNTKKYGAAARPSSSNKRPTGVSNTSNLYPTSGARKKVEGYDGGIQRPDPQTRYAQSGMPQSQMYNSGSRATHIGQNFSNNVEKLKNSGAKQVEDEYIKALQEEIKILEYQLKILKDKEIEQQAAVSQIDKFFSDGVPLNDNILALKSQYQSKKSEEERILDYLRGDAMQLDKIASDLDNQIKHYKGNRSNIDKEKEKTEEELTNAIDQFRKDAYHEKHARNELEKRLRELQDDFKRLTDQNLKINRDLEKDRVLSTHKNETAASKRYRIERDIEAKDNLIRELNDEIDKLDGAKALNPQISAIETENNELKRKILNLEKEISMAQAKIKEAEFLMDTRRKERATESQLKRQLENNIEMKRLAIDEAHRMNELIIEQKVKEKQEAELRQKDTEISKVNDRIQNVRTRMAKEEQEIEKIVHEKVTIQQDIIEQEQIREKVQKDLILSKKKAHELKIELDFYQEKARELADKSKPLANNEAKFNAAIQQIEGDIKNFEDRLSHFEKQLEFAKQVKGLNFNDLKMLNSANDNINTNILTFIKRYEDIQRMSRYNANPMK